MPKKTKPTIKLSLDAYGINARASSVADFVELTCLSGEAPSQSDLRDRLKDSELALPPEKYVIHDEVDPETVADPFEIEPSTRYDDSARRVFDLLRERERILGDRYPFQLKDHRLRARKYHAGSRYLHLLALTVAHAHGITTKRDPKQLFEALVARVLRSRGWLAADVALKGTDEEPGDEQVDGGFPKRLAEHARKCDLEVDVSGLVLSKFAKDEAVDTIAHHSWTDGRPGKWTLIGQATLEKSDRWRRKLAEPSPSLFASAFTESVEPLAFLAVPHHVEPLHLLRLVQTSRRVLLDRLRLARFKSPPTQAERDVLDRVKSCKVEYR